MNHNKPLTPAAYLMTVVPLEFNHSNYDFSKAAVARTLLFFLIKHNGDKVLID